MTMIDEQTLRQRFLSRRNLLIAGVLGVIVLAIGLVWFQPQKLFIDDTVNEAAPAASAAMSDAMTPAQDDAMAMKSLKGTFSSLAHETSGAAVVKMLNDGSRILRLEDFETSNGPDVRVYVSTGEPYGKDFVDLGGLKGNVGNQNYAIPSGTDLERYDTVVIWCRRFTVAFGAAPLAAA
jgi:hypothetical protein